MGGDCREEEFDHGEFFLNWLRWVFAEIGFYKKHTYGSFLGARERVQEAWSKFGQAKNLCECFIHKLPWYCCQLSAMGTCHLPLPGLNHVLLQLLTFNTPWKGLRVENRNKSLCGLGKQGTGGTGLQIAPLVAQRVKHLPAMRETWVRSLGQEDLLEKKMATHSGTLALRIPWMEKPGAGYSPWGRKESDTTEWLHFHFSGLQIVIYF